MVHLILSLPRRHGGMQWTAFKDRGVRTDMRELLNITYCVAGICGC